MEYKMSRTYMNVNVILTFNTYGGRGNDTQEIFNIKLVVSDKDKNENVFSFLQKKLFNKIVKSCNTYDRDPRDLIKISTASNWDVYENATGNKSLRSMGHPCKWYFGSGRKDLDTWEMHLMNEYDFGANVDMSWINDVRDKVMNTKLTATQ